MTGNVIFMLGCAVKTAKSVLVLCVLQAVAAVALNLLQLYVTPSVLDAVEKRVPLRQLLGLILAFTFALLVINALAAYMNENVLFGRITVRSNITILIHDKLCLTSYPNTGNQQFLKLLDKSYMCTNSNSSATEAIWTTLKNLLMNLMGFIIYLGLLSSLQPFLALVTLVTSASAYFAGKYINGWGYRHRYEEAVYSKKMNYINSMAADHTAAKDIRIFGMKSWIMDVFNQMQHLYLLFRRRGEKVYFGADIIDAVMAFIRNGIAYAYLISLTLQNGLSASQFLLYFTAVSGFSNWVAGILADCSTLHKQSLDISSLREYLDVEEPFLFEGGEPVRPEPGKPYVLELKNVSFRYPGTNKDTLKQISLTIKSGEKLAVVGVNGAGKTTLVKLLCGFLDPTEGEVLLNGENIKKFNRRDYYLLFSAVFQNFSVLAASVAGNVSQMKDGYDLEKVKDCIEKAGLTRKIESLPDGYFTNLEKLVYEDAPELSGGELQRLMLARALYKDAPVIILDEPTAALDPIAENDIYHRYSELTHGRTSVYISHRLASTRFCDRILLIEGGIISEEGTHEELLAKGGRYSEMYEIQSRYYQEGGKPGQTLPVKENG